MTAHAALMFVCLFLIAVYLLAELVAFVDRRRPRRLERIDYTAARKRAIARNGFKSRMGVN